MERDDSDDFDEYGECDDSPEEVVEVLKPDWMDDDWWKDIGKIEDSELREKEIEIAKGLKEKVDDFRRKGDSGEIDNNLYWGLFQKHIHELSGHQTRWALESVGITFGKLGQLSDQYGALVTGDPKKVDLNDRLDRFIEQYPEEAQELADRQKEEGKLSEINYNIISGKVKQHSK